MSNKILEIYDNIAASIGWVVSEDGFVSEQLPGADTANPVLCGQHRLVMPYPQQLKQHDWSKRYAFHPLLQSMVGGDSPVFEKTRQRTSAYANFVLGYLFTSLARLAINKKEHAALTPEQAAYLKPFSEADDTLLDHLRNILKLDSTHKNNREFVRFTVVKGRNWKGKKRARVAVAHFTVYDTLAQEGFDRNFRGIKLRVKDVRMIKAMYEHIFPNIDIKEEWERGSDDQSIAPSIETLMQIYAKLAVCVNKVIDDFGDILPGSEYVRIPLAWVDDFSNLTPLLPEIRRMTMLNGNAARGRVDEGDELPKINLDVSEQRLMEMTQTQQPAQTQATQIMQPAAQTAPAQQAAPTGRIRFGVPLGEKAKTVTDAEVKKEVPSSLDPTRFKPYKPSEVAQPAQQLQAVRQQAQQQTQQAAQQRQAGIGGVELPKGSRMIGNQLYVPAPPQASGVVPVGAMVHEGVLMIPYQAQPAAAAPTGAMLGGVNTGMGINVNNQQLFIQGLLNGTIDPSQIPGIDPATADSLRGNSIMLQNYVQQMVGSMAVVQQTQQQQQAQQIPNYLRRAAAQGQANVLAQNSGLLGNTGGVMRFGASGNVGGFGNSRGFGF